MTTRRRVAIRGFACFVVAAASMSSLAQDLKQAAKAHAIQINSNVKTAGVMEDGLLMGNVGTAFDSAPGEHELFVSAPGYVPRIVRIVVSPQSKGTVTREVNLAPSPDKNVEIEIDWSAAKTFKTRIDVTTLPSLCKYYNDAKTSLSTELMLPCARKTLLDDFAYFGRSWIDVPETEQGDAKSAQRRAALTAALDKAADGSFFVGAEELFAWNPTDPHAATLLAYSAALRRDCRRVLEIAMEHGNYRIPAPGVLFARGLCFESAGESDKAVKLYEAIQKIVGPSKVDMIYHIARASLARNGALSERTLASCVKSNEAYYPCYESLAHVYVSSRKQGAAKRVMETYHARTRTALAAVFKRDYVNLDAARINAALRTRPTSFELTIAAALAGAKPGSRPQIATDLTTKLISSPAVVKGLLPRIEATKDIGALLPVYQLLTRTFPKDVGLWIRNASALRNAGRCTESLDASTKALALIADEERRTALLLSSTDCLTRLGRLQEAEVILAEIIVKANAGWKAHYNLGVVQERLNKTDAALLSYDQALGGDMPPALREKVEQKLAQYRGRIAPKNVRAPVGTSD